jgi:hypothetical protein
MQDNYSWDTCISLYEQLANEYHWRSFAKGMMDFIEQAKADSSFPHVIKKTHHATLALYLPNRPSNLFYNFPQGVQIYWAEQNLYHIRLGIHELVVIPLASAINVVKYYLERLQRLFQNYSVTEDEFTTQSHRYSTHRFEKDNLNFVYSQMPHEWIISTLCWDVSNMLRRISRLKQFTGNSIEIDTAKVKELCEKILDDQDILFDLLDVAQKADASFRTQEVLKEIGDSAGAQKS